MFARLTVDENLQMGGFTVLRPGRSSAGVDARFALFPRLNERRTRSPARSAAASSRCWPWAGR